MLEASNSLCFTKSEYLGKAVLFAKDALELQPGWQHTRVVMLIFFPSLVIVPHPISENSASLTGQLANGHENSGK